jgi:hypothetical protein
MTAAVRPSAPRSGIEIVPVHESGKLDKFIQVEFDVNRSNLNWVPPLWLERRRALDPAYNPYFRHSKVRYWIAHRSGRLVGRISAQIDRLWLEQHRDATGHFGFLEAEDDPDVVGSLLDAAECWLRGEGLRRVLGPFSLSINEQCGLLVDGFDTPPMLMMGHVKPHLSQHLSASGYVKAKDLHAYICDIRNELSQESRAILDRARRSRILLRPLRRATYEADLAAALDIFNDAWSSNWGFVPWTAEEVAHAAKILRPIIDPRLVWFAEVEGVPAAMAMALPNLNEALADLDGRLLPFGWLKLLWRLKAQGLQTARVPLMGVKRAYIGTLAGGALPLLVVDALREAGRPLGYRRVEMSWILEDNLPVRRIIEAFGGRRYKTYRLFERALS